MSDGEFDADQEVAQLKEALQSSRMIGAAIGIVMYRYRETYSEARQRLIAVSQTSNVRLALVCTEIIEMHERTIWNL